MRTSSSPSGTLRSCFCCGEGVLKLFVGDHAERGQRLADAHHRHAGLLLDGGQQLFGGDHLAHHEDVAELLVAQLLLHVGGLFDLLRRDDVLRDEQFADARAHVEPRIGVAGHEEALHAAVVAHGGNRNRPWAFSTCPMVSPSIVPPPGSVMR